MSKYCYLLLLGVVLAGCDQAPASEPGELRGDTISTAMRTALERFRTTVAGTSPDSITGGAGSRDELIERFATAVQRADTAALIRMTMNRAEFAYLYYPHTVYTHPPYELDAETAWLLTKANSEKGLTRILQRFGGKPLAVTGYTCATEPEPQGPNRYWHGCTLTARAEGAPPVMQWFGSIWERDGRSKFVSYANDL
jgi:hypothetical protein